MRAASVADLRWLYALAHLVFKIGYGAQKVAVSMSKSHETGCYALTVTMPGVAGYDERKVFGVPMELVNDRAARRILKLFRQEHMAPVILESRLMQ